MTHKIVRRSQRAHDCDTKTMQIICENEGLGTGTVIRCEKCGQLWWVTRQADTSWKFERVGFGEYVRNAWFGWWP